MKTWMIAFALFIPQVLALANGCCCADKPESPAQAVTVSSTSVYQLDNAWTDDSGQMRSLGELRGQLVVVTMFFARCEYACPLLVNDMRRLRAALPEKLRDRVRFVLVSFDTERDTAEALHQYRAAQGLDDHWTLLRGSEADVQTLAMVLGVQYRKDARGQFAHSNLITLLNAEGEIAYQQTGLNGDLAAAVDTVQRLGQETVAR